jgi:NAD(P)-dependent dehydrogenase (short-subunit alcohol dehydrogenase family)
VTGASSGIGKATCEILTRHGASVVGTGRSEESLAALKNNGDIVDYVVADITQEGECKRVVDKAAELLGGLTTVVNAAGVLQGGAMGDDSVNLRNYQHNMLANTQAPFEITVHAVPYLKHQKQFYPSVINVSSINGKQAFAACVSYCMSKAAVDMLTRCASVDLAKDGIRVNSVNPGVIETNLQKACMQMGLQ